MDLFNLVARITLDSSEYNKQLGESEKNIQSFGSKLKQGVGTAAKVGTAAIAAVGTATVAVTKTMLDGAKETAEYGDHIDKMSQKMGISAEAYQEWDAIMQHSGTTIDALKPSMKTLASQAEKGSDAFQKLGISQEEVKNLSQEDLFAKVITGLQGMEEGSERTYLTSQLLGRGATELGALLNTSAEDTEKMRQKVHELGGVMSNDAVKSAAAYQDSLQDMQTAMSGLKRNVMSNFLPSLKKVMDGMSDLFTKGDTSKITEGLNSFVDKIGEIIPKVAKKGSEIAIALVGSVSKILPQAATSIVQALPQILDSLLTSALPHLLSGVEQIFYSLVTALPSLIKILVSALPVLIPQLVTAAVNMVLFLLEHIDEILLPLIEELPTILLTIIQALFSALPQLLMGIISLVETLFTSLLPAIVNMYKEFYGTIFGWIGDLLKDIWDAISNAFSKFGSWLYDTIVKPVVDIFSKAASWVYDTIIKPVVDYFKKMWDNIVAAFHVVIDPWIEIIKRASRLVYDSIIKPVLDYFKKLWDDIVAIWEKVSGWFSEHVIEPLKNFFSDIWSSIKEKAAEAWEGIKNVFSPVADWFREKFAEAWQKVKDVFSTGGKVFDGIKEGIVSVFKTVVNTIIKGINKVIVIPFKAINNILQKIHDIEILGVSPFTWVHTFKIPEIPLLAKGGIAKRPVIAGEDGAEAIIPLERNTEWIQKVANQLNESSDNSESVQLLQMVLNEMQTMRNDMYGIILAALRTNSDEFDGSERDLIRLVKKYAFA